MGRLAVLLTVLMTTMMTASASAAPAKIHGGMAAVGPATLTRSQVAPGQAPTVDVAAFWMDVTPVTKKDWLAFVNRHPEWRRGMAPAIFVDAAYLTDWSSPTSFAPHHGDEPVVSVSWFAARAYCEAAGKRLATTDEWELAGAASVDAVDGRSDPAFVRQLLEWYGRPTSMTLPRVGGKANVWGVRDLHGAVWEHVEDFGAAFITADARRDGGGRDVVDFCGGGALNAKDPTDYASFMRFAFRSALEGRFTTTSLGFRCVSTHRPSRRATSKESR